MCEKSNYDSVEQIPIGRSADQGTYVGEASDDKGYNVSSSSKGSKRTISL